MSEPPLIEKIRQVLRSARRHAGRPWLAASRFSRGVHYAFGLIIWSRISSGRRRLAGIELPAHLLARKHIQIAPPRLSVSGGIAMNAFTTGFAEVYALLFANLQTPGILSRFRHPLPGPAFRGVYLWDSAFIAQIWKCWEPEVAAETLQSVIELRDGRRLQHVVSEFSQSRYTQPPLIAWSVVELGRSMEDDRRKQLYAAVYEPLKAYHAWLRDNRQLPNGLFFWQHPYESGVENAPRFGSRDEKSYRDTRLSAAPDLCAYVVLQTEALAEMASVLNHAEDVIVFQREAKALGERVERGLWHEEDGVYYDREFASGEFIRSRTIASLLPLWAGIPSRERALRLRQAITAPEDFGTRLPFPSVSRRDPEFEKDMWRGPVWINTAYGGVSGLLRYGYEKEAGELAYRLCAGVYHVFAEERQVYEFYDPDAFHTRDLFRKRGNRWKAFTLGTGPQKDFVGWTGLVNTLLIEVLLGLVVGPTRTSLRPRFPEAADGITFTLEIPGSGLRVELTPHHRERTSIGTIRRNGRRANFRVTDGDTFSVDL